MHGNIQFIDLTSKMRSWDIHLLFPQWCGYDEKICIMSPHDDDAIIGAGYAIEACIANGAEVFIFIFCRGNAGYSKPEQKESIEKIRMDETINAYKRLGIREENILRFDISDFSALYSIGWQLPNGGEGSFQKVVRELRRLEITRVLVPNHYREHIDHLAVHIIGSYDSPQAGDPILADLQKPHTVKSILEYSVWADLTPEDALVSGRDMDLRANRMIIVSEEVEKKISEGILEYRSQGEIIRGLVDSRVERKIEENRYIEVYLFFDPRPRLDYRPYISFMKEIED